MHARFCVAKIFNNYYGIYWYFMRDVHVNKYAVIKLTSRTMILS